MGWSIRHYLYQKVVPPGSGILVPGHTIFITTEAASHNASLARENRAFPKIINGLRRTRETNNTEALSLSCLILLQVPSRKSQQCARL